MDIAAWLRDLGMQQYEQAFRDNAVDADVLRELTTDDLKDLGVNLVGHRRKLLVAIAVLRSEAPVSSAPSASTEPVCLGQDAGMGAGEAERRQLTVMFCDLVGSTALASRLDPEDHVQRGRFHLGRMEGPDTPRRRKRLPSQISVLETRSENCAQREKPHKVSVH